LVELERITSTRIHSSMIYIYLVRKEQLDLPRIYFTPLSGRLFSHLKHGEESLLSWILPQEVECKKKMLGICSAVNMTLGIRRCLKINPNVFTTLGKASEMCLETFDVCLLLVPPPSFVSSQFKPKGHELISIHQLIDHNGGNKRKVRESDDFVIESNGSFQSRARYRQKSVLLFEPMNIPNRLRHFMSFIWTT